MECQLCDQFVKLRLKVKSGRCISTSRDPAYKVPDKNVKSTKRILGNKQINHFIHCFVFLDSHSHFSLHLSRDYVHDFPEANSKRHE